MILVVASQIDAAAERLVRRWASHDAVLLTPRDLCTRGLQLELGDVRAGKLVASGSVHDVSRVRGVVSLLPLINQQELVWFDDSDRGYVASEMTSFLLYLLSAMECPVLGRPSPASLTGPCWDVGQWVLACRRVGLAISPARADVRPPSARRVLFVGDRVVGDCDEPLTTQVLALAAMAKSNFFELSLNGSRDKPVVCGATAPADTDDEHVAAAMLTFIEGAS